MIPLPHDFAAAMLSAGYTPPPGIHPGKVFRFPAPGKAHGNTSAWCLLFDDCAGGAFGDFISGASIRWRAGGRNARQSDAKTIRRLVRDSRRPDHEEAARRARRLWQQAKPAASDHPYLVRKAIQPHSARQDRHENLVIPVYVRGKLASLQFIAPDGGKRFLRGGQVRGGYCPIGSEGDHIVLCEGFATGATLRSATGWLVLVAFNAGNLRAVGKYARGMRPGADIVIAADHDRATAGNPGLAHATRAARAIGARLAVPQLPTDKAGTDFNDLAVIYD